jgi:hypothetical protein
MAPGEGKGGAVVLITEAKAGVECRKWRSWMSDEMPLSFCCITKPVQAASVKHNHLNLSLLELTELVATGWHSALRFPQTFCPALPSPSSVRLLHQYDTRASCIALWITNLKNWTSVGVCRLLRDFGALD